MLIQAQREDERQEDIICEGVHSHMRPARNNLLHESEWKMTRHFICVTGTHFSEFKNFANISPCKN